MGRNRFVVALVAGVALAVGFAGEVVAQSPAQPAAAPVPQPGVARPARPAQQYWRQLSPADQQRFKSNAERWQQLPPEQRQELRLREDMRRQRIQREAQTALQDSGLKLEAEKKELYERRYMQERQKIDEALRQELREKRRRELEPVVERLKKEFAPPQTPATAAPKSSEVPVSPSPPSSPAK